MPGNYCWGCGPTVETGLHLKSRWVGDEVVCDWTPRPEFAAGPKHILYGGIISAVMDCHSIWTWRCGCRWSGSSRERTRASRPED
jgi:hypothetical protein